jgi:hypothetical protein
VPNFNAALRQFGPYDITLWAMMSYVTPSETNATFYADYPVTGTNWGSGIHPITPMMLDILAAQRLYGPATSGPLAEGNATFGFNTTITGPIKPYFDFTQNTQPVVTIWDFGVNNKLDLSGWSTPSIINLEPGSFSSGNGFTNNIGIAFNTVIETAIGGGGNDTINGNAYDNILVGGPGNDLITGGPGADRFVLGAPSQGVDTYFDFAYYQGDRIALDHVGFGLSGTGGLAAAGVNFVYAFAPPSSARRPDHHRIRQRRILGCGRRRRESRCAARACLRPGDARSSRHPQCSQRRDAGRPRDWRARELQGRAVDAVRFRDRLTPVSRVRMADALEQRGQRR